MAHNCGKTAISQGRILKFNQGTMEREFCSIIIDKRKKKEILNELCTLGIDESYVYPELQYTAKKIKETYL